MSIREWFGFKNEYEPGGETDLCLDKLLDLYHNALIHYFSSPEAKNINELIGSLTESSLSKPKELFLEWLSTKGLSQLELISSYKLPNDEQLSAFIEYEYYILEDEMDFQYPEDVRASLINIANELPEIIIAAMEASPSINNTEDWFDDFFNQLDFNETVVNEKRNYFQQEDEYELSNIEESVKKQALFLFSYWRSLCLHTRITKLLTIRFNY